MPSELSAATGPGALIDEREATLRAFLAQLGSQRTREEYRRYIERFASSVDLSRATPAHVHAFAYAPGAKGREPSASTVNTRLAALGSFYDWAVRMGMVADSPVDKVRRAKLSPPIPQGLNADEVARLLAALPVTPAGVRDRAILLTLLFTGLRRSEVMELRRGDLTVNGGIYYNVRAKGGKMRHRELPAPAFAAIRDALAAQGRPLESLPPGERLWNVSGQGFYLNLQAYARKAGVVRSSRHPHARASLGVHVLRHTAAKIRRDAGESLEDVQQLLGHADLRTTARYLARLEGQEDKGWPAVAAALGLTEGAAR